jgi:hypothetical protein
MPYIKPPKTQMETAASNVVKLVWDKDASRDEQTKLVDEVVALTRAAFGDEAKHMANALEAVSKTIRICSPHRGDLSSRLDRVALAFADFAVAIEHATQVQP